MYYVTSFGLKNLTKITTLPFFMYFILFGGYRAQYALCVKPTKILISFRIQVTLVVRWHLPNGLATGLLFYPATCWTSGWSDNKPRVKISCLEQLYIS